MWTADFRRICEMLSRETPLPLARELPESRTEDWYALHRHLTGGALFALACADREEADRWHSAYVRLGDVWFKPRLSEAA